jgi:hypothetical protein
MGQPQEPNWWSRNWKWFVPVAVLSGVALLAGFVFAVVSLVFGVTKSSDAYQEALSRAKASPAVISALGSPIKEGFYVSGSINVSGPSGDAKLAIPVSGPKGEGTIYLEAKKSADVWSYSLLLVQVGQTKQRIDLLREKRK